MAVAMERTKDDWAKEKEDKVRDWSSGKEDESDSLSSHLVRWDIGPHWALAKERQVLKWKDWSIVCNFRVGHVGLNAQWKYLTTDRPTPTCSHCARGVDETMLHFMFVCAGHVVARWTWLSALKRVLRI